MPSVLATLRMMMMNVMHAWSIVPLDILLFLICLHARSDRPFSLFSVAIRSYCSQAHLATMMMLVYLLSRSAVVLLLSAIVILVTTNDGLTVVAIDPGCSEPTEEDFQAICEAYIALIKAVEPFSRECDGEDLDGGNPQPMTRSATAMSLKAMFPDCLFEEGVFEDDFPAPTTVPVVSEPPTTEESPTTMAPVQDNEEERLTRPPFTDLPTGPPTEPDPTMPPVTKAPTVTTESPFMVETEPPSSLEDGTKEPSEVTSAPIVVSSAPAEEVTAAPATLETTKEPTKVTSAPITVTTAAPITGTTVAPAGPNDGTMAPIGDGTAFVEIPLEERSLPPILEDFSTPPIASPPQVSAVPNEESTPTKGPEEEDESKVPTSPSSTSLEIIQWPLGDVCQPPSCNGTLSLLESTEEMAMTPKSEVNQDGYWYGLVGNGYLLSVMAICEDDTSFPTNISFVVYMGSECDTLTCLATGMVSVQEEDCIALEDKEDAGSDVDVRRRRRRRLNPNSINDEPSLSSDSKFRLTDFYSQPGMSYTVFLPKGGATAGQNSNVFVPQVPPVLMLEVEEDLNRNNATTTVDDKDDASSTVTTTDSQEDVMEIPIQPPTPPPAVVPSSGSFKVDSQQTPTLLLLELLSTTTFLFVFS